MSDALLALHFQNDICHRDGLIPFSLDRSTGAAANFLSASKRALDEARRAGWTIAHIHIAFAPDYSDLLRNCRLFLKTETLGALKRGSWGAAAYAGFEAAADEIVVTTNCNSGFRRTDLEAVLNERGVSRVNVMGSPRSFPSSIPCGMQPISAIVCGYWPIAAPRATWRRIALRSAR